MRSDKTYTTDPTGIANNEDSYTMHANADKMQNDRVLGNILLTKVDLDATRYLAAGSNGDTTLEGAVYDLYAADTIEHPDGVSGVVDYSKIIDANGQPIWHTTVLTNGGWDTDYLPILQKDRLVASAKITDGKLAFANLYMGRYYLVERATGLVLPIDGNGKLYVTGKYPLLNKKLERTGKYSSLATKGGEYTDYIYKNQYSAVAESRKLDGSKAWDGYYLSYAKGYLCDEVNHYKTLSYADESTYHIHAEQESQDEVLKSGFSLQKLVSTTGQPSPALKLEGAGFTVYRISKLSKAAQFKQNPDGSYDAASILSAYRKDNYDNATLKYDFTHEGQAIANMFESRVSFVLRKCTNHFRNMNSEVKLMICVDQNGQAVEISVADQMWLDDAYFKEKQLRLGTDALRAALAYRVSTKGQVDHDDIPMQKIDCRKFAQKQGWRVVKEVAEKGVSGSKVSASKRDAIQQLKEEAANGEFDILLVYMFDRLGRIESETPFVLEWFVQHGIEMWSTHEGQQKIETHGDKLMNYIRFWQAAGESEKTSIRTRDRIRQIVSSGHYTGGFVCYGYQLADQGRRNKRDKPVMDLIVNEEEAAWVRELFYKVVHEGASGYALAEMLNNRGLRTRAGAKFQSSNILRIIRHEGYTGYIITKNARSEYIPALQIIDQETFEKANDIISRRSAKTAQDRRIAHTSQNPTLLAGIVYCAHCGAKMSGFMHTDRYKLADGSIREKVQPKYNCFQRGQRNKGGRDCDGQALYLAERVDAIVLKIVEEVFEKIRDTPYSKMAENRIRQESNLQKTKRAAVEKKIKAAQHALERFEGEILKCLDGTSNFTEDMIAKQIRRYQQELDDAKAEYAELRNARLNEVAEIRKLRTYYNDFRGWAEEFDTAPLEMKRMILSQLINKVEVGRKYQVNVKLNMKYQQFVENDAETESGHI